MKKLPLWPLVIPLLVIGLWLIVVAAMISSIVRLSTAEIPPTMLEFIEKYECKPMRNWPTREGKEYTVQDDGTLVEKAIDPLETPWLCGGEGGSFYRYLSPRM